jgi:hypothetical protein
MSKREEEATPEDAAFELIDRMAALTLGGDEAFVEIRTLYESDERLRFPADWEPAA